MAEDLTQAAKAVQAAWKAAFEARRFDDLAALYARETAFYGSTRPLYTSREGVHEYFRTLPAPIVRADFEVPHIVRLGEDAFAATGEVTFHLSGEDGLTKLPYRMTHVFVREEGAWKIATHHASPRPPA